jgi:hypothetical protein
MTQSGIVLGLPSGLLFLHHFGKVRGGKQAT